MVLEPRILLDASLVDTTSIEADPEQPTDLRFDVPGTRVSDPRVLDPRLSDPRVLDPRLSDPRLSDPQDLQRMITPDLPTIRNWLDTANTHNARLSIVVKLWDAQPEDRISLAETYTGNSVLQDTWDDARGELRLEPRAGAASPAVAEAFLDALQALQLEASGAEDVSTREVWVFPTLADASEVAYRVERSSGMVRHYVLDASLDSYADARKTAEQQRFFGVDGYLGHFSSDAEKSVYGSMAQGRPVWLGLSDRENVGVWKVSSGPKEGQVFWRETDAGVGIYGSGARSSGLPGSGSPGSGSPGSGWGDADWEKLWGTNDFPRRVSLGSGFPVAFLDGDDAEVSSSEDSKGARIVHHDLLLSSGGFFAREVRVPKTSSTEGGRSDADTGDTAEVAPQKEVLVRKTRASLSRQTRQSPPSSDPPVLDVSGLGGMKVRMQQRLVLTDGHLSATDADTVLSPGGGVDPSKITFRISVITGGKLQSLLPSGAWEDMTPETGEAYYAFTLADLQAGKVAFLAGDGLASGNGERIAFKVQAVDDDGNLSDSDDATPGAQTADGSVGVDRAAAAMTARVGGPINEDGVLTPDEITLGVWQASATTHGGTLHLVVKLQDKESGDALSLRGNYDTSKITPLDWDAESGELSLEVSSGATAAEIGTALGRLWLDTAVSASDGTRQVWVFPTLSGASGFGYRVDETAGLVRYYLYDSTSRSFADATTAAAGRSLFGKSGYLGVPTSDAEKSVYKLLRKSGDVHLAITDSVEEGKWLVTAGPRKGQLFWDNTEGQKVYGPGAAGSGWNAQTDFWYDSYPSNGGPDQARMSGGPYIFDLSDGSGKSVGYHDLRLADGEVFMRPVDVGESPPRPFLEVDVVRLRVDSGQLVVLTEDHIQVEDVDTVLGDGSVDASSITLRITGLTGGTLRSRPSDASDVWTDIDLTPGTQYREFTLADLKAGQVAFLAGDGVAQSKGGTGKTIVFQIQAADDGDGTPGSPPNLSDADPSTSDPDPVDVEILIRLSAKVIAGSPGLLNADGLLTPDGATLTSWKEDATTHGGALHVIVKLVGHHSEALSLRSGYRASKITPLGWDPGRGELQIGFADNTTISEMKTALELLELKSDFSSSASALEVWIFPILSGASGFGYRVDETAGLVRYYCTTAPARSFADATTAASERSPFWQEGVSGGSSLQCWEEYL